MVKIETLLQKIKILISDSSPIIERIGSALAERLLTDPCHIYAMVEVASRQCQNNEYSYGMVCQAVNFLVELRDTEFPSDVLELCIFTPNVSSFYCVFCYF